MISKFNSKIKYSRSEKMNFDDISLSQKFWVRGQLKILSNKTDKMPAQNARIGQRPLQKAKVPLDTLVWLLRASNEKECAISPYARALCEIALSIMKFITEEQQTAAPQTHPASVSYRRLAMILITQVTRYEDRSGPKVEAEPPTP